MPKKDARAGVPRVFISYSHDSAAHEDRVYALSERLRRAGVESQVDLYEMLPTHGWQRWMDEQLRFADFVLVVCTKTYRERFEHRARRGTGLGAKYEGAIISREIYASEGDRSRFIPVVFAAKDRKHIPALLFDSTHYNVTTNSGFERLYRYITKQPEWPAAPVGEIEKLPARRRKTRFPSVHAAPPADGNDTFRILAGEDVERITTTTTTVITQSKTLEAIDPAFDGYEFLFWQDVDGKIDVIRHDVLGQLSGRTINHAASIVEADSRKLRLYIQIAKDSSREEPLTFIAQVSCENYYPHLFTMGTGYTTLQVRHANPSFIYRLEVPNRPLFSGIEAHALHNTASHKLSPTIEGGDRTFMFGPVALKRGDRVKFSVTNINVNTSF